jgi:hypothetical protein
LTCMVSRPRVRECEHMPARASMNLAPSSRGQKSLAAFTAGARSFPRKARARGCWHVQFVCDIQVPLNLFTLHSRHRALIRSRLCSPVTLLHAGAQSCPRALRLPRHDQAIQVLAIQQHAPQLAAVRQRHAHARQGTVRDQVANRPRAHAEVGRRRVEIQQARRTGHRIRYSGRQPRRVRFAAVHAGPR